MPMPTVSDKIKELQNKVAITLGERAKSSKSSDDDIKKELKKLIKLDENPPTTASGAIANTNTRNDDRKKRLTELAKEVDREMAYQFMMEKLGVSYEFQNQRLLNTKEKGQVRTPAEAIAQYRRSEKVASLLAESMKNSRATVKEHLTKMMEEKHKFIEKIDTTFGAGADHLTAEAIKLWKEAKQALVDHYKDENGMNPDTFHKIYLGILQEQATKNPNLADLADPEKNALLAFSSQMNMMAEVGAEMTGKLKQVTKKSLESDNWEIDPRPKPEVPVDPSAKPVEKKTRLEAALDSLEAGNPSPTKPKQTSLELEKQVLKAFDEAVKKLNKAMSDLREALSSDHNPTSADIAAKTKAVEAAHLTVAGMLANPTQKIPLQRALSKKDLNTTLSELTHVRNTIISVSKASLHKTPETVDEMNPDPAKKPDEKSQVYAWEKLTKLPPQQEVSVTYFEWDEAENKLKEKELLHNGKPLKPTAEELILSINKINAEIDEMNARTAGTGVKPLEHATIKIDDKGNYAITWPNKQLNKKFQEEMIALQDKRLAKNATNQANTSPAALATGQGEIPPNAAAADGDDTAQVKQQQQQPGHAI